jgi:flagellar FliL protein
VTFDLFLFLQTILSWRAKPLADVDAPQDAAPVKKSKKPLLIGLILALLMGGGGFYATWSGLVFGAGKAAHDGEGPQVGALPDIAFVPVDPLVITLGSGQTMRHLRFTSQIEVVSAHAAEVQMLLPRIVDVLNSYMRAVNVAELEDPAALVRIRAHLLRRIQIVTGEGRVRDLLVTEFVLN